MNKILLRSIPCLMLCLAILNGYAGSGDPIGWSLNQGFPSVLYANGGTYQAIYTFKNNLPAALKKPLYIHTKSNSPSEFQLDDACSGILLASHEECQVKIYLNPTSPGLKTIQLTETYGFDRVPLSKLSATATGASGGAITGEVTTALPNPLTLNQASSWKFTFSNEGNEAVTGVTVAVTGSPAGYQTTCGLSLDSNSSCIVEGNLTPSAEGGYTVQANFSYAQGATVSKSTSSSTSSTGGTALVCTPAVGFAPQILTDSTNPVTLLCTNNSSSTINLTNSVSGAATLQGGTFSTELPNPSGNNNCNSAQTSSLASGASCQLTGTYIAPSSVPADSAVSISLAVTYTLGGTSYSASTSTSTSIVNIIDNQRTITLVNQCNFPVWWGMVGGAVTGADPNACPAGSTANNGRCLYNGFAPTVLPPTGTAYELPAWSGTGEAPTATTIITQTLASTLSSDNVLWKGLISASTGCIAGTSCANNDCGSAGGTTQCTAGFQQPATEAEFTFLLTGGQNVDTYDITQVNGFSIPMSMGTTIGGEGYTCTTAGSVASQGSLPAANYSQITPPSNMYYWVNNSGVSCNSGNTCSNSSQICGLAFSPTQNNFVKACGSFLGFWSANQICQTSPNFSSPFGDNFTCNQYLASPFPNNTYTLTQLLKCSPPDSTQPLFNSCYLSYSGASPTALQQCCGCTDWTGVTTPNQSCPLGQSDPQWESNVLPLIQWMKRANPTGYSYPYDDEASTFQCSASSSTHYTITFCPSGQTGLPAGITDGREMTG